MLYFKSQLKNLGNYFSLNNDCQKSLYENIVNPQTADLFIHRYGEKLSIEIKQILDKNESLIIKDSSIQSIEKTLNDLFLKIAKHSEEYPTTDWENSHTDSPKLSDSEIKEMRRKNWKQHVQNLVMPSISKAIERYMEIFEKENELTRIINDPSQTIETKKIIIHLYDIGLW